MWAERVVKSDLVKQAMRAGVASEEKLRRFRDV